jgi:hypothetical protein
MFIKFHLGIKGAKLNGLKDLIVKLSFNVIQSHMCSMAST